MSFREPSRNEDPPHILNPDGHEFKFYCETEWDNGEGAESEGGSEEGSDTDGDSEEGADIEGDGEEGLEDESDDNDYVESEEAEDSESVEESSSSDDIDLQGSGEDDVNLSELDFNSDRVSESEDEEGGVCPVFNPADMYAPQLKLKMMFSNKWEFIEAVHSDSIIRRRDIRLSKNERERVYAKCNSEGCEWAVHARVVPNEPNFQITTYQKKHTCPESFHIKSMRSSFLSGRYGYQFKNNPKKEVAHFKSELELELGVKITDHQAYKAKKMTLASLNSKAADVEYTLVWDYAQEIRRTNPGSTVLIGVNRVPNGPELFDRMYICLYALKVGMLLGCRKLIGVDGCHLKGPHGGVLLSAIGVDPNNNILPIAYAVVGKENGDTWDWFLSVLKRDLEIENGGDTWTIISDKQKGLVQAVQSVLPDSAHRFCLRHMHGNAKTAGFRTEAQKVALHAVAKATTKNEFNRRKNAIRELSSMFDEWLSDKPPEHWCRSHFDNNALCDMVMNNICESFNAAILKARELPIVSMLEWIMNWCMTRFAKHRDRAVKGRKWKGLLCPQIQKIIDVRVKRCGECNPSKSDSTHYQVKMTDVTPNEQVREDVTPNEQVREDVSEQPFGAHNHLLNTTLKKAKSNKTLSKRKSKKAKEPITNEVLETGQGLGDGNERFDNYFEDYLLNHPEELQPLGAFNHDEDEEEEPTMAASLRKLNSKKGKSKVTPNEQVMEDVSDLAGGLCDINSQVVDEITPPTQLVLKRKDWLKQLERSKHISHSSSVPPREPPSMDEQYHGRQKSEELDKYIHKDGIKYIMLKNLGSWKSRK